MRSTSQKTLHKKPQPDNQFIIRHLNSSTFSSNLSNRQSDNPLLKSLTTCHRAVNSLTQALTLALFLRTIISNDAFRGVLAPPVNFTCGYLAPDVIPTFGPCDVTFVTVPKAQTEDRQIQRSLIALADWLSFPNSRVLMTTDRATYDPQNRILPKLEQVFGRLDKRIIFTGELPTGYDGRPLVREWFRVGRETIKEGYLVFLNSDIVVTFEWMTVAMRVFHSLPMDEVMIYGVRNGLRDDDTIFNMDIGSPSFPRNLHRYCVANQTGNNPYGMDLFMIHSSMREWDYDDFPGYVVGLCVWDNSFISWANHNFQTVTTNFNPTIYHIEHGRNKCNNENYRYFRSMAARWHVRPTFQVHRNAVWRLDYKSETLRGRRGSAALKPIEDLPKSCNYGS